jgi:hypothetical protein
MSDNTQRIHDAIEDSFQGVQLEGGISLHEAVVLDDYGTQEERRRARLQDELDDWRRIPDETIGRYSASLAFLDAKGMRFYLPAFMRFAIRHYQRSNSPSIDYLLNKLNWSLGSWAESVDVVFEKATEEQRALLGMASSPAELRAKFESLHSYQAERLSLLTEAQRDAVRGFLEFMAFEAVGHVDSRFARQALERVWGKRDSSRQPGAPPKGGPAAALGNSGGTKGPPSGS